MSWYKFAKDYINSVVNQRHVIVPQLNEEAPLEGQINGDKPQSNGRGIQAPGVSQMLNYKPDLMKATGVGGEYNLKSHQNQFPEGADEDNFINPTDWNTG